MEKIFYSNNASQTVEIGEKLGKLLKEKDVVLLVGDLSAGKTTLTKGIGLGLGVKSIINSPTFTLVKEYVGRCPLYHLDLYRLNGLNEDFYLEEYMEGDGVCVIEWPYQVEEVLPKQFLKVELMSLDENKREIKISSIGSRYDEVLKQL